MLFILRAATDNMIKLLAFALLGAIYTANGQDCQPTITTVSGSYAPQQVCAGYLIFEDNFDNFDLNRWAHEINLAGGGNFEFQWYTNERTNSYTQDGVLHIKPTLLADEKGEDFLYSGTIDLGNDCTDSYNNGCRRTGTSTNILNPIKSARIRTLNSFSFRYGKVEVRAKVPAGDWLWPAIWMLPTDWAYGNWPVSGEQDIMESRGNRQFYSGGTNIGVTQMGSTLHWGPDTNNNKFMMTHWEQNLGNGYDQDFHRYQLEWTDNYIKFAVDDVEIGRIAPPDGGFWQYGNLDQTGLPNPWQGGNKMAPFDKQFHLIINLAIGGTNYFPDTAQNGNGQKPWSNTSPTAMTDFWKGNGQWKPTWNMGSEDSHLKVDYVRVWAL